MKKSILYAASLLLLAFSMGSCNPSSTDPDAASYATGDFKTIDDSELSNNEKIFKRALVDYVHKTVFVTYEGMADNAILLADQMAKVLLAAQNGDNDNTELITKAGEYWTASRKYWEQSEAFLYGPAGDYNIDPHIDSWPFDQAAFDALINDATRMEEYRQKLLTGASLEEEEYGLMGYHALEYVLYQLNADSTASTAHKVGDFTVAQWTYMNVVANDLRNQSILLEAAWKGMGRVSVAKQTFLRAANMTGAKYTALYQGYAASMLNPGAGDVAYATYQEGVEELIAGAIDIADEVANSKIGAAANAQVGSDSYQEDHDNIESPYSLHSIIDFQDNIRSIQHAFFGTNTGDHSVNDFMKQADATLSTDIADKATAAIEAIGRIQEPFVNHAKDNEAQLAITAVNDLMDALNNAYAHISGHNYEPEEEE